MTTMSAPAWNARPLTDAGKVPLTLGDEHDDDIESEVTDGDEIETDHYVDAEEEESETAEKEEPAVNVEEEGEADDTI